MIQDIDIFLAMLPEIKYSTCAIIDGIGPYEGYTQPMVDFNNLNFELLTGKNIKPKKSFMISYI